MRPRVRLRSRMTKVMIVLTLMITALSFQPGATAQSMIHIDRNAFDATIPHEMSLGSTYTINVIVVNNSSDTAVGLVSIDIPDKYLFTATRGREFSINPGSRRLLQFDITAHNPYEKSLKITATLLVTSGEIVGLVDRLSAEISRIDRPVDTDLYITVLIILLISSSVPLSLYLTRPRKRYE